MKKTVFTGSGVAIVTPMHQDGTVNFEERYRRYHYLWYYRRIRYLKS